MTDDDDSPHDQPPADASTSVPDGEKPRRVGFGVLAVSNSARSGVRSGLTLDKILERVQQLTAENIEIRQRLEQIEAVQRADRQKGGQHSKDKPRRTRTKLVHRLDTIVHELTQQGKKASLPDAAKQFYRTTRAKWWATLAHEEKEREASNLVRRYHRGNVPPKKS